MSTVPDNQADAAAGIWSSLRNDEPSLNAAVAEVTGAIMALAEEQRTANLLAYLDVAEGRADRRPIVEAIERRLGLTPRAEP